MSGFFAEGSGGKAVTLVRDRIRASEAFQHARKVVFEASVGRCAFRSCEEMRALGGFSAVLREEIARLPESADDPSMGSRLFPYTVRSVLDGDVPKLREELQFACSTALETTRRAQDLMRGPGTPNRRE